MGTNDLRYVHMYMAGYAVVQTQLNSLLVLHVDTHIGLAWGREYQLVQKYYCMLLAMSFNAKGKVIQQNV